MPAPLTRNLGQFVSDLAFADIPKAAVDTAILGITDTVGVTLSGVNVPGTKAVRDYVVHNGGLEEARIYFGKSRSNAADATIVNSVAAHAVVLDDVSFGGSHPGSVMVPAILAEAEAYNLSGQDVIRAYIAGFETWAWLFERDQDAYSTKGWHLTSVLGVVATAAAIASLRGLSAAQATQAIAIATSMSSGTTGSFLSDTKAFQVGRAAGGGVTAARLAIAGMTALDDAIEGRHGLLFALSPKGRILVDEPFTELGRTWQIERHGLNIKRYPFFNAMHRSLDGMFSLKAEYGFTADDVVSITALIGPSQAAARANAHTAGQFIPPAAIELALAAAVIAGEASFEQMSEPFYTRPDVQAMMAKVSKLTVDDIPADNEPNLGFSTVVRVKLKDGRELESANRPFARGHRTQPLSSDELWAKFSACYEMAGAANARPMFDALQSLEGVASIRDLPSTEI